MHEKYVYIIVQIYIIFYFSTDYFLVKYVSDGILSIKEEDDLEHEIIIDIGLNFGLMILLCATGMTWRNILQG